jgi:hypothetical protein
VPTLILRKKIIQFEFEVKFLLKISEEELKISEEELSF